MIDITWLLLSRELLFLFCFARVKKLKLAHITHAISRLGQG